MGLWKFEIRETLLIFLNVFCYKYLNNESKIEIK
jgi:hypothetical protein